MKEIDQLVAELTGPDESAAEAAVAELAQRGELAAPAILGLLESRDAEHRWWAVRTLAAMEHPRADWLLQALSDSESEVRAAAALALAAHPDPQAAPTLVQTLSDQDNLAAVLAVSAVVKLGEPTVPLLLEAYEAAPPRGRIQLMRALAELQDPRAIKLMMNCLEQGSAAEQYWAQAGLERLGLNMVYLRPEKP